MEPIPAALAQRAQPQSIPFLGAGPPGLERASSFTGPTQTPGGTFAKPGVDPLEADQDDPGVDRRLVRFLAVATGLTIPQGHAKVYNPTSSSVLRSYDMEQVHFVSVAYVGLKEDLSFTAGAMTWSAGDQTASYP